MLQDQKFSEKDIEALSWQRDKLIQKLDEFEETNRKLRKLLVQAKEKQVLIACSLEQNIFEYSSNSLYF